MPTESIVALIVAGLGLLTALVGFLTKKTTSRHEIVHRHEPPPATQPVDQPQEQGSSPSIIWIAGSTACLAGLLALFITFARIPGPEGKKEITTPTFIPDPLNPRYNRITGEVTVDNLPADMELAVYWRGGTSPPEGPPFNAGALGGWQFGAARVAQIGQNATNVRVRFSSRDHRRFSTIVSVP